MKIDLGPKKVSVNTISQVVVTGYNTVKINFIFRNAIIVRCRIGEDDLACRSTFRFAGTPKELCELIKRLKGKA